MSDDIEGVLNLKYGERKWHCDDIWADKSYPECVTNYLTVARAPAYKQMEMEKVPLYATYEGKRVRVTMASRFGDVGITFNLDKEYGYDERVFLLELTEFSIASEYSLPKGFRPLNEFLDEFEKTLDEKDLEKSRQDLANGL